MARHSAAEGAKVAIVGRRLDCAEEIVGELQAAHGGLPGFAAIAVEPTLTAPGEWRQCPRPNPVWAPSTSWSQRARPKPRCRRPWAPMTVAAAFDSLVKPHQALVARTLPGMRERRWGGSWPSAPAAWRRPCPTSPSPTPAAPPAAYLKTSRPRWSADGVTVTRSARQATDRVTELDQARPSAGAPPRNISSSWNPARPSPPAATANSAELAPPPPSSAARRRRTSRAWHCAATAASSAASSPTHHLPKERHDLHSTRS